MSEKTINNQLIEKINLLIEEKKVSDLNNIIKTLHNADIAEIIKQINLEKAKYLYKLIKDEKAALVIVELEDNIREQLLSNYSAKEIAVDVIENLESDDAADLISEFSKEKKEEVLSHIENIDYANNISDLLSYSEDTAGGLMAKELIKVNENWNTLLCLKEMRKQAESIKKVHTIYVVNDEDQLLGLLSLRKLLLSQNNEPIKNIIKKDIVAVNVFENNEQVASIMRKYDLIVLPVVNDNNELVGRITIDDVMDVVKEEAEKDYQMASGIIEDIEINDNIWTVTKARLPWLLIGMIGGLIGAELIGFFNLKENIELTLFIPLIAAMGGNVGVQSAAIVVQGIANNSLKTNNIINRLFKELITGVVNGFICSLLIFIPILLLGYDIKLCIIVSISLLAVIVFAALFGTFIPITLKKYNIDPALATGPFITTINDILGLFIYFLIGKAIF